MTFAFLRKLCSCEYIIGHHFMNHFQTVLSGNTYTMTSVSNYISMNKGGKKMEKLNAYIEQVKKELAHAIDIKASMERKINRLETILGNASFYFEKEAKKKTTRFRRSMGEKVKPNKTAFQKRPASNVPEIEPEISV